MQSTLKRFGSDKIFLGKRFYQPLISKSKPEVNHTQTNFKKNKNGWVRVLRHFNSISVISRRWKGEHERLCAMKRRLGSERISPSAGFEPATPWSEVGSANRSATRTLQNKNVLNDSFACSFICYHAQITTILLQVCDSDDFQNVWKTLENAKFCMCDKTVSVSKFLMFYSVFQFVTSCWTHVQQEDTLKIGFLTQWARILWFWHLFDRNQRFFLFFFFFY